MNVHGGHTRMSGVLSRILLGIVVRGPPPVLPDSFLAHRLELSIYKRVSEAEPSQRF